MDKVENNSNREKQGGKRLSLIDIAVAVVIIGLLVGVLLNWIQ